MFCNFDKISGLKTANDYLKKCQSKLSDEDWKYLVRRASNQLGISYQEAERILKERVDRKPK